MVCLTRHPAFVSPEHVLYKYIFTTFITSINVIILYILGDSFAGIMCNRMTAALHVFAGLRGIPLAVFPSLRFVPYAIHSAYLGLACMSIP